MVDSQEEMEPPKDISETSGCTTAHVDNRSKNDTAEKKVPHLVPPFKPAVFVNVNRSPEIQVWFDLYH